jgi:serine/threonine-protein kinase
MPYVEGESLRHRLDREKQFPVDDAVRIAVGVASALAYAHGHGVIHRDLKPENVMLREGVPVVMDFGIALAVSNAGGTRITQTGISLGTPQYMSPEQATGDRTLDGRSDIYSLAAVTYEMLTGDPPHTGSTMQAVIARVLTERPRPVRAARPTVPEHVAAALERALEKLPADRWPTAQTFADALEGRATSSRLAAPADGASAESSRGVSARVRDPMVLAALAVAVIGAAFGVWKGYHSRADASGTTVRFAIARPTPGQEIPPNTQVAISPNGTVVAYVIRGDLGRQLLALRDVGQLGVRLIQGSNGNGVVWPFFSPDGQWIGFVTTAENRGVRKMAVGGGPVITIANSLVNLSGVSWGSGDTLVGSRLDTLILISAADGTIGRIRMSGPAPVGERGERNPRVLADGNTVLYQSWRGSLAESKIGVLSLRTGQRDVLDVAGSPIGAIDDILIYGTASGTLMGVRFDVSRHRLTGSPQLLLEHVQIDPAGNGFVRASVSSSGSLIYATGARASQVVLVDMQGAARVLVDDPRDYSSPRFSPDGKRLAVAIGSASGTDVWIQDLVSKTLTKLTTEGQRNDRP